MVWEGRGLGKEGEGLRKEGFREGKRRVGGELGRERAGGGGGGSGGRG